MSAGPAVMSQREKRRCRNVAEVVSRVDPLFAPSTWLPGPDPVARWRRSDAGLRVAAVTPEASYVHARLA
jgi:hypothetical protein